MKNLFKLTLVLAAAALTLTGCDCFKKMAKNPSAITVTCTPDVLVLNNGKVVADVTAEVPAKYFNKTASLKVTPVLFFEGGMVAGETLLLQGEKVATNGMVVKKGDKLFIQGRIRKRKYADNNNVEREDVTIEVERMEMLTPKQTERPQPQQSDNLWPFP